MMIPFYLLGLLPLALAAPADKRAAAPTVVIPSPAATVIGKPGLLVETFNGIPFAKPPTGQLRLKPPQKLDAPLGTIQATGLAKACPQFFFSLDERNFPTNILGQVLNLPIFQQVTNAGEDCLTVNIQRPAGTKATDKLPVLFWIFGGGFELGSTLMYDATSLVAESIVQGKPIMFVAVNYRVGGFGFLPGKEVLEDGSANLGLLDQRCGLEWVADNIAAFGGDPSKVTIWGESAGSISVLDQMLLYDGDNTYNGKPLFRGGIMNSGSVVPADPVDCPKGQKVYDTVVANAGCASAQDTLDCLRKVDYKTFLDAANSVPGILSYDSIALSYLPRPDGTAITVSPDVLVQNGKYAKVPFIIGSQEDEGTIFALFQKNITTPAQITGYLKEKLFHSASTSQTNELVGTYQTITEDGSPFRTLLLNNWYPQFKRLAAILGDLTFTLTRRLFLNIHSEVNPGIKTWSYLSSYDYGTPILGTFHGSDLLQVFYGVLPNYASSSMRGYYYSFVHYQDPNQGNNLPNWPAWSESKQLLNVLAYKVQLIKDDFRADTYAFIEKNFPSFKI